MKKGSFYPSLSFMHALQRIWDPDTYDINGNTEEIIMEKPKAPEEL